MWTSPQQPLPRPAQQSLPAPGCLPPPYLSRAVASSQHIAAVRHEFTGAHIKMDRVQAEAAAERVPQKVREKRAVGLASCVPLALGLGDTLGQLLAEPEPVPAQPSSAACAVAVSE